MAKALKSNTKVKGERPFGAAPSRAPAAAKATPRSAGRFYTALTSRYWKALNRFPPPPDYVAAHRREGAAITVCRSHRQRHGRGAGGHSSLLEVVDVSGWFFTVTDNGRVIPVRSANPKFPRRIRSWKSSCGTLHSGGISIPRSYETSGGLHGVGVSSSTPSLALEVESAREQNSTRWAFERGASQGRLEDPGQDH